MLNEFERFMARVDTSRGEDACWPFNGELSKRGSYVWRGTTITAPRASFLLFRSAHISEGLYVCHSCDNAGCVNPSHLWLGTPKQNTQDMYDKGRGWCDILNVMELPFYAGLSKRMKADWAKRRLPENELQG